MSTRSRRTLLAATLLIQAGCFRTVYRNLEPAVVPPTNATGRLLERESGWQHFFVYGWFPRELIVNASRQCGGVDQVREIRTRQTFAQGLIATFAGYYVNIYSPYTGQVLCSGSDLGR
jgi:hypothetical protein